MILSVVPAENLPHVTTWGSAYVNGELLPREHIDGLGEQHLDILWLCQVPRSVMEIAVHLSAFSTGAGHTEAEAQKLPPRHLHAALVLVRAMLGNLHDKQLIVAEEPELVVQGGQEADISSWDRQGSDLSLLDPQLYLTLTRELTAPPVPPRSGPPPSRRPGQVAQAAQTRPPIGPTEQAEPKRRSQLNRWMNAIRKRLSPSRT
jgi:hypothetical protein